MGLFLFSPQQGRAPAHLGSRPARPCVSCCSREAVWVRERCCRRSALLLGRGTGPLLSREATLCGRCPSRRRCHQLCRSGWWLDSPCPFPVRRTLSRCLSVPQAVALGLRLRCFSPGSLDEIFRACNEDVVISQLSMHLEPSALLGFREREQIIFSCASLAALALASNGQSQLQKQPGQGSS